MPLMGDEMSDSEGLNLLQLLRLHIDGIGSVSAPIREAVKSELEILEYDGLYNPAAVCACALDDLMPCVEPNATDCRAGHFVDGPCSNCTEDDPCDFHIADRGQE